MKPGWSVAGLRSEGSEPILEQCLWDLWKNKWEWNRVFYRSSLFTCQYHSTNSLYTIFHLSPSINENGIWRGNNKINIRHCYYHRILIEATNHSATQQNKLSFHENKASQYCPKDCVNGMYAVT